MHYPKSFTHLIRNFSSLPSVGPRLAERLVLFLFRQNGEYIAEFAENIRAIGELSQCKQCFHIAEGELCAVCADSKRDRTALCVVEDPLDVIAMEKTGAYRGLYHILGGTMGTDGEGDLTIAHLLRRVGKGEVKEIILATNPTAEGDLTALYLRRKLKDFPLRITRLARGLSTGGDIEYADEETLSASISNRREYGN